MTRFPWIQLKILSMHLTPIFQITQQPIQHIVKRSNFFSKSTSEQQKAWIRFSGPRLNNGKQCAAFEVRITGSTIDHPKQLHYIDIEVMDTVIEAMPGTPKALKLEEDSKPMPAAKKKEPKVEQPKEEEEVELSEPPQSDDPAEWEAFLAAEGLVDPDAEFESFDDDENFDSAFA